MLLVRDKKKPKKEPFLISQKGYEGLDQSRYVPVGGVVTVTAEAITVTPFNKRRETPPAKKRD